jgi:probable rRNA maturation factor
LLDVDVIGDALPPGAVVEACVLAAASAGIEDGHVAVEFVDAERIAALGDVVICPEHTEDLVEADVHGVLHLTGMDHEADEGEMLALQAEIMDWIR